uniref:Uncharacterized protein n=1 Tax=Anguilla anguilla TaxID=7936 RepID=A0A0E9WH79_ANGAN
MEWWKQALTLHGSLKVESCGKSVLLFSMFLKKLFYLSLTHSQRSFVVGRSCEILFLLISEHNVSW